ncbi:MAG: hypothetical protein DRN71_04550 [Candidatus Nanohalarchaeota archaeon]|nr:MAG: hypothetical protein DRN71_04550 [Candidatus Nanohaloarchaeota archaeon]
MQKEFITDYILRKNTWWKTGKVEKIHTGTERKEYIQKIQKNLKLDRIICLAGIRRSGKSTLLHQLIARLLKSGTKPQKIVYVKIDDLIDKTDDIRDIADIYHEITGINPKNEKVYFILDEIHFLKNWQFHLKYFIDSKYKSKFIISGSSKTLLYKDAAESLAGRIRFIDVFPLTFSEFTEFSGIKLNLKKSLTYESIKHNYHQTTPKKQEILHLLRQYLSVGGFPEWFKIKNMNEWQKTLTEDYLSLILYKDIVHTFKIKDPILLEKLVNETALYSTNRFSYTGLSNRLDADRETIKLYLYYLNSSMLIFTSEVYFKTKKARERIEKKIYFWEEGMRKALAQDNDEPKAIENIVAWHLIKKGMEEKPFFNPYYWKNKHNHEIDFILDAKELTPIETKYRQRPQDTKSTYEFMEKYKLKKGIIVTKDLLDRKEKNNHEILFIPAWLFLLSI